MEIVRPYFHCSIICKIMAEYINKNYTKCSQLLDPPEARPTNSDQGLKEKFIRNELKSIKIRNLSRNGRINWIIPIYFLDGDPMIVAIILPSRYIWRRKTPPDRKGVVQINKFLEICHFQRKHQYAQSKCLRPKIQFFINIIRMTSVIE